MATCCKSDSTFFKFLLFWLCDVGRVAVKHCFKLLSFYIYPLVLSQSYVDPNVRFCFLLCSINETLLQCL